MCFVYCAFSWMCRMMCMLFIFIWRRKVFLCSVFEWNDRTEYLSGTEAGTGIYLQHGLRKVSVEESNHLLHVGTALGPHCDHVTVPKPTTHDRNAKTVTCLTQQAPCYNKKTVHQTEGGLLSCWPVLEVLDTAQAFKPAVHHDAQPGAQSLTLLHTAEDRMNSQMKYTVEKKSENNPQLWKWISRISDLCDVSTTERPVLIMSRIKFQRNLRAFGSIPVVGSSCKSTQNTVQ